MVKFNIVDFAATSQFEFMSSAVSTGQEKLGRILTFCDENDCIDLAIKVMEGEGVRFPDNIISYSNLCTLLDVSKDTEIKITGDEKKDKQAQLMKDLAAVLRTCISSLNGCSLMAPDQVATKVYHFLLELREKKGKQAQSSKLWSFFTTKINWKISASFIAFSILVIVVICFFQVDALAAVLPSLRFFL